MTKKIFEGRLSMAAFAAMTRHRCAWSGCTETTPIDPGLPPDWRWLVLWPDTAKAPTFEAILAVSERDCVLCPTHADMLHNEVLEDIGQRLDKTEGSA